MAGTIAMAAFVLACLPAHAQTYPTRAVELVVPFAAGGGSETVARLLSEGLSRRLGQPFVVLNRPGANTNVGTLSVVRAKPDGHTLVIASVGLAANPSLYRKLGFDPQQDLVPITLAVNSPTLLVVPHSLPVNSLQEFIAYAKARPGELNYGSYGAGSGPHLAAGLFATMTGMQMVHVPYNGGGPAAVGVMTGQVQALFSSVLPVLGLIRGEKVKVLGVAADRRFELIPEVPTFLEQGLDYRSGTWFGLLAPTGTSPEVVETLSRTSVATLREPTARAKLIEQGADVIASTPSEFRKFLKDETDRLAAVIRGAKISLD
jgi:tripartite-type tricarboxylate transporter receptor subunit TctC